MQWKLLMVIVAGMFMWRVFGVMKGQEIHHGKSFPIGFFLSFVLIEMLIEVKEFRDLTKIRLGEDTSHQKVTCQYFSDGFQIKKFKNFSEDTSFFLSFAVMKVT